MIEVGVDVPNASIMRSSRIRNDSVFRSCISCVDAVGRGAVESQCVLMYQSPLSDNARQRLAVMRATNDGFQIAQQWIRELRGPGVNSWASSNRLDRIESIDPVRDAALIPDLQKLADDWLAQYPREARQLIDIAGLATSKNTRRFKRIITLPGRAVQMLGTYGRANHRGIG